MRVFTHKGGKEVKVTEREEIYACPGCGEWFRLQACERMSFVVQVEEKDIELSRDDP